MESIKALKKFKKLIAFVLVAMVVIGAMPMAVVASDTSASAVSSEESGGSESSESNNCVYVKTDGLTPYAVDSSGTYNEITGDTTANGYYKVDANSVSKLAVNVLDHTSDSGVITLFFRDEGYNKSNPYYYLNNENNYAYIYCDGYNCKSYDWAQRIKLKEAKTGNSYYRILYCNVSAELLKTYKWSVRFGNLSKNGIITAKYDYMNEISGNESYFFFVQKRENKELVYDTNGNREISIENKIDTSCKNNCYEEINISSDENVYVYENSKSYDAWTTNYAWTASSEKAECTLNVNDEEFSSNEKFYTDEAYSFTAAVNDAENVGIEFKSKDGEEYTPAENKFAAGSYTAVVTATGKTTGEEYTFEYSFTVDEALTAEGSWEIKDDGNNIKFDVKDETAALSVIDKDEITAEYAITEVRYHGEKVEKASASDDEASGYTLTVDGESNVSKLNENKITLSVEDKSVTELIFSGKLEYKGLTLDLGTRKININYPKLSLTLSEGSGDNVVTEDGNNYTNSDITLEVSKSDDVSLSSSYTIETDGNPTGGTISNNTIEISGLQNKQKCTVTVTGKSNGKEVSASYTVTCHSSAPTVENDSVSYSNTDENGKREYVRTNYSSTATPDNADKKSVTLSFELSDDTLTDTVELFKGTKKSLGERVGELSLNNVSNNYSYQITELSNYVIKITDKLKNESYYEISSNDLYIDNSAPEVVGFTFAPAVEDENKKLWNFLTFGLFQKKEFELTVTATDSKAGVSGINLVTDYTSYDGNGSTVDTVSNSMDSKAVSKKGDISYDAENNVWSQTFTCSLSDFSAIKFDFKAYAVDKLGSESEKVGLNSKGVTVECNGADKLENLSDDFEVVINSLTPEIDYNNNEGVEITGTIVKNGNRTYYDGEKEITVGGVTATDNISGINSITVSLLKKDENVDDSYEELVKNSVKIDSENKVTSQEINGIAFESEDFADKESGVYRISITVVNNSKNETTVSKDFNVDFSDPEITGVKFSEPITSIEDGLYYGAAATVTVTAFDEVGVKEIKLGDLDGLNNDDGTYTFTVPQNSSYKLSALTVTVTDAFGKETSSAISSLDENTISIENTAVNTESDDYFNEDFEVVVSDEAATPEITVKAGDKVESYKNKNDEEWYSGNVEFTFGGTDKTAGFKSVKVTLNDADVTDKCAGLPTSYTDSKVTSFSASYTTTDNLNEGKNTFAVIFTNNCGVETSNTYTVYYDKSAPSITQIDIDESAVDVFKYESTDKNIKYGYYFNEDTTVTVYASDSLSDIKEIRFETIPYESTTEDTAKSISECTSSTNEETGVITYKAVFTIKEGFKGQVCAYAFDNVENKSDCYSPDGIIYESQDTHNSNKGNENNILISTDKATALKTDTDTSKYDKKYNGVDLYKEDVPVSVMFTDKFNGLNTVTVTITTQESLGDTPVVTEYKYIPSENKETITVDDGADGTVGNTYVYSSDEDFEVSGKDENLNTVIDFSKTIKGTYCYVCVEASLTDMSGNISSTSTTASNYYTKNESYKPYAFSIDENAPEIYSYKFEKAESAVDKIFSFLTFGLYSNSAVEVTVTAKDGEGISGGYDEQLTDKTSKGKTKLGDVILFNGENELKSTDKSYDYENYTLSETFTLDKSDKAYNLKAAAVDNAGNETDGYTGILSTNSSASTEDADNETLKGTEFASGYEIVITDQKPEFTEAMKLALKDSEIYIENKGKSNEKVWCLSESNEIKFTYTVTDDFSGLKDITVKTGANADSAEKSGSSLADEVEVKYYDADGKEITNVANVLNLSEYSKKTGAVKASEAVVTVTLEAADYADKYDDGALCVYTVVTNNSGNTTDASKTVYLDRTAPIITEMEFTSAATDTDKLFNFLTFGLYSNDDIEVTVKAEDNSPSSGIKSIELKSENGQELESGNLKTEKDENGYTAEKTFTLKNGKNNAGNSVYSLKAKVTDNAGNVTGNENAGKDGYISMKDSSVKLTDNTSDGNNEIFEVISTDIKPDEFEILTSAASDKACGKIDGKQWYSGNVKFDFTVKDELSGIKNVKITMNGTDVTDNCSGLPSSYTDSKQTELNVSYTTSGYNNGFVQGKNTIKVTVTNNSGNSITESADVYVDTTSPKITGFTFPENYNEGNNKPVSDTDESQKYSYYFKKDTTVTVTASDVTSADYVSGVNYIVLRTVDVNGKEKIYDAKSVNSDNQASFVVPADFKGELYAYAVDRVDNGKTNGSLSSSKKEVKPDDLIVETKSHHDKDSNTYVKISRETSSKTDNGKSGQALELFGSNVNVRVEFSDVYAGIRTATISVQAPQDQDNNYTITVSVNNSGDVSYSINGSGTVKKVGYNKQSGSNLVEKVTVDFVVANNSNNISVSTNLLDRSGNTTSNVSDKFSIDKTTPVIDVAYDNNEHTTFNNRDYYKADRTATITVTECNFDSSLVEAVIDNEHSYQPTLSGWTEHYNSSDPDSSTYTATIYYNQDGDYTFDIDMTDKVGNESSDFTEQKFTVDKTVPVIEVSFDNNSAQNSIYYDKGRVATVTINEHNFNSGSDYLSIDINATAEDNTTSVSGPSVVGWNDSSDIHTATISFTDDGKFSFTVDYTDLAGNKATQNVINTFYVDKTAPEVIISNVENNKAYNGTVAPIVSYKDNNFTDDTEIHINRIDINADQKDMADNFNYAESGNGVTEYVYTYDDFSHTEEVDGIYNMSVTLSDKAGNATSAEVTFSVNRFGSTYMYGNEDTENVISKRYINEEHDIVVKEINVNTLSKNSVTLNVGSSVEELTENKDYTCVNNGSASTWSEYVYTVGKENFENEGQYTLTISSVDLATNSENNRKPIEETRKLDVSFVVDKTVPSVSIAGIKDNYAESDAQVKVRVIFEDDYLDKDTISIDINGKKYSKSADNGEDGGFVIEDEDAVGTIEAVLTVKADGDNSKQTLTASISDLAGNSGEDDVKDYTLSANFLVIFFTNYTIWAYITVIALGAIIVGLTLFLIMRRRKKDDEGE